MKLLFKAPARFDADGVAFNRHIIERLADAKHDVIVDMTDVELIDGSGFGAIAHLHKRLTRANLSVRVINVGGQPRDLMAKTGMLGILGASSAIETDAVVIAAARADTGADVPAPAEQRTAA